MKDGQAGACRGFEGDAPRTAAQATPERESARTDWWAVTGGILIGALLCVFNILVIFKTGVAFGGSALVVVVGAVWLRLRRRLAWHSLFVVFSIASSGYLSAAAIGSGIAANHLRDGSVPPWAALAAVVLLSNAVGLVLGLLTARMLKREELPFPTLRPAIVLMEGFSRARDVSARPLVWSALASAAVALAVSLTTADGSVHLPGTPGFVGLALSPMLLGVGALAGSRSAVWMLVGGVCSAIVWSRTDPADSYTEHLSTGPILAIGIGVITGYSVATLVRSLRVMRRGAAPRVGGERRAGAALCGLLLVGAAALCWYYGAGRGLGVALLLSAMTLLFALFFVRVGAETGIAPLSPAIFLGIILLRLAGLPVGDAIVLSTAVSGAAMAALYYTYAVRVSDTAVAARPAPRTTLSTQALGGWLGAIVGLFLMAVLLRSGLVGQPEFPAPLARAFDFVATAYTLGSSQAHQVGPSLAAAVPAGFLLTFAPVSPSALGLGMLLPPATVLTMSLGGGAAWLITRKAPHLKEWVGTVASGLVIGEGVVSAVIVAARAIG
ncbi:OPT/YSL family transporter [Streptomyces sp. NPDC048516]|uniref:OPT/YSL family transporter n=1 Tax=Streptomyces sp. NPDC048516 TaxID=3365565 RepID=UPI00371095E5